MKVVAYGLWHESDQRLGNFVHNDIETATYEASQAAIYGYTLMPLVKLTDHEAALAEVKEENSQLLSAMLAESSRRGHYADKYQTLITGLKALAGEWEEHARLLQDGTDAEKLRAATYLSNASEVRQRILASAGLEGKDVPR